MDIPSWKAKQICWKHGHLDWKLKLHQMRLYRLFHETKHRKVVFHCSRRIGKSFTLLTICNELAMRKKGALIKYAAPTQKNVRDIILPVMRQIIEDCPESIKPQWKVQDQHWFYPSTGATISVAGTDAGHADSLRGPACDLGVLDEAGFISELSYVVRSIFMPQFITTDGRMILSSSSPKTPAHDFTGFMAEAEIAGAYEKITIYEDSRPEVQARIPEWMEESGGKDSTDWKREYECELVTDQELAIVPEFTDQKASALAQACDRPLHFDAYVGMDVGFNDLTGVLFAYWDFLNARLVIEDELVLSRMTTAKLAQDVAAKEKALWGEKAPFLRVSDTDLIVINDLGKIHGLHFSATRKDDKEAAINAVRMLVAQDKIVIHPRCKNLVAHLKYGVWNKQKTQFERASGFGHYDLIDALVYLVRSVRREKNPWPATYGMATHSHYIPNDLAGSRPNSARSALEKLTPRSAG
jgi:hypothetical protein